MPKAPPTPWSTAAGQGRNERTRGVSRSVVVGTTLGPVSPPHQQQPHSRNLQTSVSPPPAKLAPDVPQLPRPWRCPSLRRSSSRRPRQLVELVLSWYILLARPLSRREGGTCLLWTSGSQSAAGTHRSIEVLTANKSTWTCSTSAPTSLVGCLIQLGVVRSRQTARQELQVRAEPPHPPSPHSLIDPGGTGCPP